MSLLIQYLVKLSISLSIVWLFYQFILRRLTFYNSSRWYLLGYTFFSFFIPFINISSIIGNSGSKNDIIHLIPSVHQYTAALEEASHCPVPIWSTSYDKWDWIAFALMVGAGILLLRFIIRYISFIRVRNRSKLISAEGIKIYQVDDSIIPFSFGNAVFINSSLHTEDELREIVRHEFVHVRQNHTIDIIWAELLCIINWYNPFAWLLKRSIRQNLEFIADDKVVENGIDKKEYQYLLLKVIGNNQYSIATQFNFSSLKKRIAMMNKTKSTKRQLLRMLVLLPATAILLLAFRNKLNETSSTSSKSESTYNNLQVSNTATKQKHVISDTIPGDNLPKDYKEFLKRNPQIENIKWSGGPFSMTINLKNGSKEIYNLENRDEVARVERKYGKLPAASPLLLGSVKKVEVTEKSLSEAEELAEVKEVTITEVPAKVVNAELAEVIVIGTPSKKAVSTTGEIKEVTVVGKPAKTITTNADQQEVVIAGVPSKKAVSTTGAIKEVTVAGKPLTKTMGTNPDLQEVVVGAPTKTAVSPTGKIKEVSVVGRPAKKIAIDPDIEEVTVITDEGVVINENEEVLIIITKKTTKEQLEFFKKNMKDQGIEVTYDKMEYENGKLINIIGSIKSKDTHSNFGGEKFGKLTIIKVRKGEKIYFQIRIDVFKVVS